MSNFQISEKAERAGLLMEGALAGDRTDKAKFFEGLTSGEIPISLLQAPLTARLLDAYEGLEEQWTGLAERHIVDDFELESVYRFAFDDESQILEKNDGKTRVAGTLPRVGEMDEYQTFGFSSSNVGFRAYKSGIKFGLSWEAVINGRRLNLIERAISKMARMARDTEVAEVVGQYVTPTGLNTANLKAANLLSLNPALSMASLQAALALAAASTVNGHLASVGSQFTLVVSPTLAPVARNLLSITEITTQSGTGNGAVITKTGNPVAGLIDLKVMNSLLTINSGAGAYWFLVPNLTNTEGYRPELWFVRGEETPKFFVKSTTVQDPSEGDFDHDAWETKLRATASGVNTGMLGVVASTGAGS